MKKRLIKEFTDIFEVPGEALFFSPGRVNLIGEHTDYNGGMVFPCTGRTYYTHFPFLYTPPHRTARKAVPPRLSEGAAHKKAAAPGEERVRLPSGLCRRQDRRRAIPANRPPRRSLRKGWGGRGWFRRDRGLCSHAGWRGWFRRSDRKRGLRRCARRGACRCLLQRRA